MVWCYVWKKIGPYSFNENVNRPTNFTEAVNSVIEEMMYSVYREFVPRAEKYAEVWEYRVEYNKMFFL